MNLGHETETLEFKKTTGELKEGVVSIPVNTPDKDIRSKIVSLCLNAPQTREQLMQACGMKNKAHFLKAYLKPMLETGELQLTVPDKPNSRNQKYIAVRHTTGEVR